MRPPHLWKGLNLAHTRGIVGNALGLLGDRLAKTEVIVNWMADMPGTLANDFFSRTQKCRYKVHLTPNTEAPNPDRLIGERDWIFLQSHP